MEHEERLKAALADRYRIEREIGSGGMATVYLAQDLKHDREVAVKVLIPELAAVVGTERFLAEIRTTAKLSHPHILPLHDSGEADGLLYYVMPFVEGESLRERLERERQLPVEEAIGIVSAVARALSAAHDRGIVHRDIKPANILLGTGGPLVADFGIATAQNVAREKRLTGTGQSVGTPGYMSPEQITGDNPVDRRSDVYSLGCVLYEMLLGEAPYTGSSAQAIIAGVLAGDVRSARAERGTVPLHVDAVIRKALERFPADRFSSCEEMLEALADPSFTHGVDLIPALERVVRRWRFRTVAIGVAAAVFLGAWLWTWLVPPSAGIPPVTRFSITVDPTERYASARNEVAIAPDGRHVAFVSASQGRGNASLFVRALDELVPRLVPGSAGARDPFFSPDGQWVGYATVNALMKVPLAGGEPEQIVAFAESRGPYWTEDDRILFGSYSGLWSVDADGGDLEPITTLREDRNETAHTRPVPLPGGEALLFTIREVDGGTQVASLDLGSGEIQTHVRGLSPKYSPTGHLLFGRDDGTLMAAPFGLRGPRLTGAAEPVLTGVVVKPGSMDFDLSRDGTVVYLAAGAVSGRTLVLVDRNGEEQVLFEAEEGLASPRFSPDGERLAVGVGVPPTRQVWVYEMGQGAMAPVTFEGHNYYGIWSPDGSRITFAREKEAAADIFSKPSDGSGVAVPLLQNGQFNYPEEWSPDGACLVVREQDAEGGHDLFVLPNAGGGELQPLRNQAAQEESPALSPDGRWVAYGSDLSGISEIYVTAFPTPGGRTQVSIGGGTEPAWDPRGGEILYWRGDTLVAATVESGEDLRVLARRDLLIAAYHPWRYHRNYDVHPDGQRFAMIRPRDVRSQQVVVAQNWTTLLTAPGRVP